MAAQPPQPQTPESFARVSYDEQADRLANAATFADIPHEQLPWAEVRVALQQRALAGYDCYAYLGAHQPHYVIWDRQPDPAVDARFTPRAWAIQHGYAHLVYGHLLDGQEVR